jgi:predicted nucleic acid-binding protein
MIAVADTDILSMFGKVKSANLLRKLFHEIHIPIGVYEELLKTKEMGFSFIDEILKHVIVINFDDEEHKEYLLLLKKEKYLHKGELMCIVSCKHRKYIFLTNDKHAKNFCRKNGILFFDIKGIMRAFFLQNVLNEKEIRRLASEIEEKDNTSIKGFEEIFSKLKK